MLKRYIAIVIVLLLTFASLSGCKKQDEYGGIEDVNIIAGDVADKSVPAYEKQDNPFTEYKYKKVDFECAKMSFEIPSTWNQQILNQSCIKYQAPNDDPYFPGDTLYVKCVYDYSAVENDLDTFAHHVNEFGTVMAPYITGLPFTYGGDELWIRNYSNADEKHTPSYCKDATEATIKVTKDVTLMDKRTGSARSFEDADFTAAYLKWEGFPVMFAITTPKDQTDDAKKLLEYMLSGVSKIPHKIKQTAGYEYRKIRFTAPTGFESANGSGNIFIASPRDIKSYSGMSLGVFSVEDSVDVLTDDYINENYASNVAGLLLDPGCAANYDASASVISVDKKIADEKISFEGYANIIPITEDHTTAGKPYGMVAVWLIDMAVVERSGKTLLVATLYPPNEEDIAKDVKKMALQSLAIAK